MLPDFYKISEENFNKSLKYYNLTNNTIKFSHQSLSKFKQYTNEYCSKLDKLIKEGKNVIEEYIIIDPDNINNDKDKDNKYEPLISNEDEEKKEIIDENEDIYEENENKSSEEEINTKLNEKHNNDDDEEDKELEDKRKR